jgi:hypothetical protein
VNNPDFSPAELVVSVSPDFSPLKFFADQGAVHEAVVNHCKWAETVDSAEKSCGLKGGLFDLK